VARSKLSAIGQVFLKQKPIERALRRAAANAIEQHRRAGLPLVIWRDGKTVLVSAEELAPRRKPKKRTGR
jgi:hypothetical protein